MRYLTIIILIWILASCKLKMASFQPSSYSVQAIKKKIASSGMGEFQLSYTVSLPVLKANAVAAPPSFIEKRKEKK
jgi:hypothetical protein